MSWLFGSGKRAPSGELEIKAARERQISSLQDRVPGLQQKSTDSSLYEVQIRAPPDGATVKLRVFLPTKFPAERPGTLARRVINQLSIHRAILLLLYIHTMHRVFERGY